MKEVRREMIQIVGGEIPVTLSTDEKVFIVQIDGVEWVQTENKTHAVVLFEMIKDHVTQYMHYEKI